jgi:hypothetical protein
MDVSGSNWHFHDDYIPSMVGSGGASPEYGIDHIIQTGGNVNSFIDIDNLTVGGTANSVAPTCIFQSAGRTDHVTISNCRTQGVTYLASSVGIGGYPTGDIGGSGNSTTGLTALFVNSNGYNWTLSGQFASTASASAGSGTLTVQTSGTGNGFATAVITGTGANAIWAFTGGLSTTGTTSLGNGVITVTPSTAPAIFVGINSPVLSDAYLTFSANGVMDWITGASKDFATTMPYIIYNQANSFLGEEITAGDVVTLAAGTLTVNPGLGINITGSAGFSGNTTTTGTATAAALTLQSGTNNGTLTASGSGFLSTAGSILSYGEMIAQNGYYFNLSGGAVDTNWSWKYANGIPGSPHSVTGGQYFTIYNGVTYGLAILNTSNTHLFDIQGSDGAAWFSGSLSVTGILTAPLPITDPSQSNVPFAQSGSPVPILSGYTKSAIAIWSGSSNAALTGTYGAIASYQDFSVPVTGFVPGDIINVTGSGAPPASIALGATWPVASGTVGIRVNSDANIGATTSNWIIRTAH